MGRCDCTSLLSHLGFFRNGLSCDRSPELPLPTGPFSRATSQLHSTHFSRVLGCQLPYFLFWQRFPGCCNAEHSHLQGAPGPPASRPVPPGTPALADIPARSSQPHLLSVLHLTPERGRDPHPRCVAMRVSSLTLNIDHVADAAQGLAIWQTCTVLGASS